MFKITLFFTYGISLNSWEKSGFLSREISYYQDLVSNGVEVQFFTFGNSSDLDYENLIPNIKIIPIYSRISKPKIKLLRFLQSFFIPFYFKDELKSSDIFKTNQMWGSWIPLISKFIYRKPLLARVGYDLHKNSLIDGTSKIKLFYIFLLTKITYKLADFIWVPTDEIKLFINKSHGLEGKNILVSPNWIDTDLFKFIGTEKIIENRILFIGRLSKEKNIPLLINALKDTGIGLDVIGVGHEEKSLKSLAQYLNVDVRFLGRVANIDMPLYINRYEIYVLCSDFEGNPKSLLEAMSCQRAVIGTDQPGIQNLIVDSENGLLVDSEAVKLRDKIVNLIADKDQIKTLGLNARKGILRQNSKKRTIQKEIEIFKKISLKFIT
jgi:glycosyltransferase involved in cell wall biosynthesis